VTRAARRVPRAFYARPTLDVLADILGLVLVHEVRGRIAAGVIVEAEAYIGESDPACHAAPGPTRRNAPLYGPPGRAYVYLNYGLHYLVNAVTEPIGSPAAILIRALEPVEGLPTMRRRRERRRTSSVDLKDADLCRGPGNLAVALGITLAQNWGDLVSGPLRIEDHGIARPPVVYSPRIGIRVGTAELWRAHVRGHPGVSGRRSNAAGLSAGAGPGTGGRRSAR
jgi:DNA-3-methyladenine glycosylase